MARPRIQPVVWTPPRPPYRGEGSASLPPLRLLPVNGTGPEDALIDRAGRVLTGVEDGRLLRMAPDGSRLDVVADTRGRPMGIELLGDGRLLVCDAHRGLLRVDPDLGTVETLVTEAAGTPLRVCNNAAVGADGSIYFTDSSQRFDIEYWLADLFEHSGTGRLLRRDPYGGVDVLLDGLQFANGVALAPDDSFVLVAETGAYRIRRVWLSGARAGDDEMLVDNLPGIPDNLSTGTGGRYWVALPSPRDARLDTMHQLPPVVRQAVWAVPDRLRPKPRSTAWVIAIDGQGQIVQDLRADACGYRMVTGVREHDGRLYLGSLTERAMAMVELPCAG